MSLKMPSAERAPEFRSRMSAIMKAHGTGLSLGQKAMAERGIQKKFMAEMLPSIYDSQ